MQRRSWILVLVPVCCAMAQSIGSPSGVNDLFQRAARALSDRKPAALWLLFDPAMPGYKQFRTTSEALLRAVEPDAAITIVKDEGDDHARSVELDWRMELVQRERFPSTTRRDATVRCRLEKRDANWRIVSFAPLDLFAPVHAGEAWDELVSAVSTLTNRPPDNSPVNPSWFFRSVDPSMPDLEKLRAELTALLRRGEVESSLDMVSNEGDDQTRTLEVDWSMQILDDQTQIAAIQKEKRVQIRMSWQGKRWRIVSLQPLDFFEMR